MNFTYKKKILATSMLVMPAALVIGAAQPAHATCAVTSGGGTVTSPTDGSVITCTTAGGNQTTTVGDSTAGVGATVNLEANSIIRVTGFGIEGIDIDNVVVTLDANAGINTTNGNNAMANANHGIRAFTNVAGVNTDATVTLSGDGSNVTSAGKYSTGIRVESTTGDATNTVVLSGDGAYVNGGVTGLLALATGGDSLVDVTLSGDNTLVTANRGLFGSHNAVQANGPNGGIIANLTGNNASIQATNSAIVAAGGNNWVNVTLGQNTSVIGTVNAISLVFTGAVTTPSIIDNSGLIQGGNAILLNDADDILNLRTGSNIAGAVNLGGGTDTINLFGTGGEDQAITNAEILNMNGTSWSMSGVSTYTDININSGTFTNNSANLSATDVNINAATTFTNTGTLNVTNDVEIGSGATLNGIGTVNGDVDINSGGNWTGIGTVVGNVNVNSGGLWDGTGTATGAVVNDGTVGPGNSIGTQTINGTFTQNAGGLLDIEYTPATIDLLDITGTATLGGTVQFREFAQGVTDGTTLTFIQTTGGIAGAFATVADSSLFIDAVVNVVGNDAQVTFNRILSSGAAQTGSENAVADAIDSVLFANPTSIPEIDTIINALGSDAAASDFFASQSNLVQGAAVTSGFSSMEQGANIALGRLDGAPGLSLDQIEPAAGDEVEEELGMSGVASGDVLKTDEGRAIWAEVFGSFGSVDGDANARGMDYEGFGLAIGGEKELTPDILVGLYGSFSETEAELDGLADESETKAYQLGLYGGMRDGDWRYQGTVTGAWMNFETSRVTPSGIAKADFHGAGAFAKGKISKDIPFKSWIVSPLIGLETALVYHESYNEIGATPLNLSVESETTHQLKSLAGVELKTEIKLGEEKFTGGLTLKPSFGIVWAHEFSDTSSRTSANFASASTINFQSDGPERDRNSARISAELVAHRTEEEDVSLYIAYDANLAKDHQDHKATLGFKYKW